MLPGRICERAHEPLGHVCQHPEGYCTAPTEALRPREAQDPSDLLGQMPGQAAALNQVSDHSLDPDRSVRLVADEHLAEALAAEVES